MKNSELIVRPSLLYHINLFFASSIVFIILIVIITPKFVDSKGDEYDDGCI